MGAGGSKNQLVREREREESAQKTPKKTGFPLGADAQIAQEETSQRHVNLSGMFPSLMILHRTLVLACTCALLQVNII